MNLRKYSLILFLLPICSHAQSDWCGDIKYPTLKGLCNSVVSNAKTGINNIKQFAATHQSEACAFTDGFTVRYNPLKDNQYCDYDLNNPKHSPWYHYGQSAPLFFLAAIALKFGVVPSFLTAAIYSAFIAAECGGIRSALIAKIPLSDNQSKACALVDGLVPFYSPLKNHQFCDYDLNNPEHSAWYHRGQGVSSTVSAYLTYLIGRYVTKKCATARQIANDQKMAKHYQQMEYNYNP